MRWYTQFVSWLAITKMTSPAVSLLVMRARRRARYHRSHHLPLHHPATASRRGGAPPESQGSLYTRPQGPSARAVSFAMICPAAKQSCDAQTYLDQLCQMDAGIAQAHR